MSIIKFPAENSLNGRSDRAYQIERLTPQSLEAEQSTLGAMLLDGDARRAAIAMLHQDDFYRENHRQIFGVLVAMDAAAVPVDLVIVCEQLRVRGELEGVGGIAYIGVLLEACPSSANIVSYAGIVRDCSIRRRMIVGAMTATDAAYSGDRVQLAQSLALLQEQHAAEVTARARFKPLSWDEFEETEPAPMVIEGTLQAGTLGVIYGAPGSFKSFIALDMALSVASGRAWQGKQVLAGPAVYIAGEGVAGLKKRRAAWLSFHQVEAPRRFYTITQAPVLPDANDVSALIAQLKTLPEPPKFIVLDTLARCMAGFDENSTGDMQAACEGAGRLQREFGACVLLVHHTGKDGRMRGNSSLLGAVDTQMAVRAEDRLISLSCEKQKDWDEFSLRSFKPSMQGIGADESLALEATESIPVGRKLTATEAETLALLEEAMPAGLNSEAWQSAALIQDIKRATYFRAQMALRKYGLVRKDAGIFTTVDDSQT